MLSLGKWEKRLHSPIASHAIILLLICISCFVLFWQTGLLLSGFRVFINDHLMITMHHDVIELGLLGAIKQWVILDHEMARFQPFYYIQAVTLSMFFGTHAVLWFLYACILTSLMGCFLFLFARLLEMPMLVALLFSGITLIGVQAATWAQPSHPQLIGMFLLSAAMLTAALSVKQPQHKSALDITFTVLVVLASLSKESFIIFIPALLAIKVWLHSRFQRVSLHQAIVQNWVIIAFLLSLAALEVLYILLVIGTTGMGYAGVDQNTFKISRLWTTLLTLAERSHFEIFVISAIMAVLITVWKKQSFADFRILYPTGLIVLLIVLPQVFLYAKSGIDGIYLVPGIIGFALLVAQTLSLLQAHSKLWGNVLTGFAIVIVLSGVPAIWNTYSQMASDSRVVNSFLQQVQACTPRNEPILVVLNPKVRYEIGVATRRTLDYALDRNKIILATYGLDQADFYSESLKQLEADWSFINPQNLVREYRGRTITKFKGKRRIAAIAIYDDLKADFLKTSSDWFVPKNYRLKNFPNSMVPIRLYCKKQS